MTGAAPLAGFWIRFLGWFLDGILYGLVAAAFSVPGIGLIANAYNNCVSIDDDMFCPPGEPNAAKIAGGIALIAIGVVIVIVLFLRALAHSGQTWGAKIVGVKVIRTDNGEPIGMGKAIGRTLFANVLSSSFLYLGYLWAIWDGRNQTWQDKVVGSIVIRTK